MRTLLVIPDRKDLGKATTPMFNAWVSGLPATIRPADEGRAFTDLSGFDVVLSRMKFRRLAELETIDWGSFEGLRVHSDFDAFNDEFWRASRHRGQWRVHIPRHQFDYLVVTGMRAQEHFESLGIRTILSHKAYDPALFFDEGQSRSHTIVMYGAEYQARILAREALTRAGHRVQRVEAPITQLSSELNRHLAALVCTLDATPLERSWLSFRHFHRGWDILPGPEPMLKLFESVAAGCATFTDYSEDLDGLGFVDGENVIIYRDIDELVEKVHHYMAEPQELSRIGRAGARLASERHTWEVRTQQLRGHLEAALETGRD